MFTIEFKGRVNQYLKFKDNDYDTIYPKIRDGKMFIDGREIFVDPSRFAYIQQKIMLELNSRKEFIDIEFVVDNDGNCVCSKSYHGSNQIDRFLSKLLG